jgi:hypothetical protein
VRTASSSVSLAATGAVKPLSGTVRIPSVPDCVDEDC